VFRYFGACPRISVHLFIVKLIADELDAVLPVVDYQIRSFIARL
jgi:hypothetical protein